MREADDADGTDRLIKSPSFLGGVMRPLEGRFRSPTFLSAVTLGELGNILEWTIHGWMHLRWTHTTYDPATGAPIGRSSLFDIDPKWDDPRNDDLGDFYSSHVHPTFWRLHGWIDDRINDWAAVNHVRAATIDGVPWFEADGDLVRVSEPFYWPTHGHNHHGGHDADVHVMEEVMAIMQEVLERPTPTAAGAERTAAVTRPARQVIRETLLGIGPALPESLDERVA
jgi:hypothetical protein